MAVTFNASLAVVEALIAGGADLEARSPYGSTSLHLAVTFNASPAVVEALIEAGADLEARAGYGLLPVDLAENNEALKGTDAYRRLNEARFKE